MLRSCIACSIGIILAGCAPSHQSQTFYVCVAEANDVDKIEKPLRVLEQRNGFKFVDGREHAFGSLTSRGEKPGEDFPLPVVHFNVRSGDGSGVTVTNIIAPSPEIIFLGITSSGSLVEHQQFVSEVAAAFSPDWVLHEYATEVDCKTGQHSPRGSDGRQWL